MKFSPITPLSILALSLLTLLSTAQKPFPAGDDTLVSGVQQSLAIQRKQSLSGIGYNIRFSVPAVKDDTLVSGVQQSLAIQRKQSLSGIGYNIRFSVPAVKNEDIKAEETISFICQDLKHTLVIDFKEQPDHLQKVTVNKKPVAIRFEKEHILISPEDLKKGNNEVTILFTAGNLSLNRNDEYLYTLLVPERARTVFPCFDQPDLKAVFKLTLQLPLAWKALTNAPLHDSTISFNTKTYHYEASDTISTYLFSFAAGRFQKVSRTINGNQMNFYHRETDSSKIKYSMDAIFKIHADAISFMEKYTKIPYPFKKFDFVAIPDFQYGGMEHPGAIQYKAASLFLDSGATRDQEIDRCNLLAHETAHMWFGDLVTMRWFNDVWMKEVFANFMADKITQVALKGTNYQLKFLLDHYPAAYSVDRTPGANPIRQQLDNLQDAGSLYGNIIYHKAPVVMLQLETLMGRESFRKGLQTYLKKYAFSNASWPDLIEILDSYTPIDLQAWNDTWVNKSGRPSINYILKQKANITTSLLITQKSENGSDDIWQQSFDIIYPAFNHLASVVVNMNSKGTEVKYAIGKKAPPYLLLNTSGTGYGIFPSDPELVLKASRHGGHVMRASSFINFYENMLDGHGVTPGQLLETYIRIMPYEYEEQVMRLITGQMNSAFWQYTSPGGRMEIADTLEKELWATMEKSVSPGRKKILFKAFQGIASTEAAKDTLYAIWKNQHPPAGLKLNEDEYLSIATALAIRNYKDDSIMQQQLARTKNTDRRKRIEFMLPSLSPDVNQRNTFFHSLKDEKNRETESWVLMALQNLHHPLRSDASEKYLKESLELLSEIQLTGDIFFPQSWLQSTFGYYQSVYAADIVRNFLKEHPDYNPKLKAKILQTTDGLFRAEKILSAGK